MRDIVRIGRAHLATDGAAALSLRAVARDLGVVSSAVYRYVASRDELLTLLVVDGYDELGDAVDAALAQVDRADHAGRMVAIGRAVRAWALAEPATYALLFGSPVPGYEAPAERTTGPGHPRHRPAGRGVGGRLGGGAVALPDESVASAAARPATWPGSGARWGSPRRTAGRPRDARVGGALRVRQLRGVRAVRRRTPSPSPRTSSSTTSQVLVEAVGLG